MESEVQDNGGVVREAATLARQADPSIITDHITGDAYLFHHHDLVAVRLPSIDPPLPKHIAGGVVVEDQQSLIEYARQFNGDGTRIFASAVRPRIIVSFDYHIGNQDGPAEPGRRVHHADWPMPFSAQWKAWFGLHEKPSAQADFALFLREHLEDVRDPAGAVLLEVATSLQGTRKVSWKNGVTLANGDVQLSYDETTEGSAGRGANRIVIPEQITLGIPVFNGGDMFAVPCFLRWRITDSGGLVFVLAMKNVEVLVQTAVREVVAVVGDALDIVPIYGMPSGLTGLANRG